MSCCILLSNTWLFSVWICYFFYPHSKQHYKTQINCLWKVYRHKRGQNQKSEPHKESHGGKRRKSFSHAERPEYLFFCLWQEHRQKTLIKNNHCQLATPLYTNTYSFLIYSVYPLKQDRQIFLSVCVCIVSTWLATQNPPLVQTHLAMYSSETC